MLLKELLVNSNLIANLKKKVIILKYEITQIIYKIQLILFREIIIINCRNLKTYILALRDDKNKFKCNYFSKNQN
jgi:ribosomal protein S26